MATLTIRLSDEKRNRLQQLAEFDAETRFRTRATPGSPEEALRLLEDLDRQATGATISSAD